MVQRGTWKKRPTYPTWELEIPARSMERLWYQRFKIRLKMVRRDTCIQNNVLKDHLAESKYNKCFGLGFMTVLGLRIYCNSILAKLGAKLPSTWNGNCLTQLAYTSLVRIYSSAFFRCLFWSWKINQIQSTLDELGKGEQVVSTSVCRSNGWPDIQSSKKIPSIRTTVARTFAKTNIFSSPSASKVRITRTFSARTLKTTAISNEKFSQYSSQTAMGVSL